MFVYVCVCVRARVCVYIRACMSFTCFLHNVIEPEIMKIMRTLDCALLCILCLMRLLLSYDYGDHSPLSLSLCSVSLASNSYLLTYMLIRLFNDASISMILCVVLTYIKSKFNIERQHQKRKVA